MEEAWRETLLSLRLSSHTLPSVPQAMGHTATFSVEGRVAAWELGVTPEAGGWLPPGGVRSLLSVRTFLCSRPLITQ